jgi:hypothetical protein
MNPDDVIQHAEEIDLDNFTKSTGDILGRLVAAIDGQPVLVIAAICAVAMFIEHILGPEEDSEAYDPEMRSRDERIADALAPIWTPALLRAISHSLFNSALPEAIQRYSPEEQRKFDETIKTEALKHLGH